MKKITKMEEKDKNGKKYILRKMTKWKETMTKITKQKKRSNDNEEKNIKMERKLIKTEEKK